jgi:predicted TIM-barrel fold metal-dependent hydrolase
MAGDAMDPVRRTFDPEELRGALDEAHIYGTVLVQTLSSADETREFLHLAAGTDFVHGVVGWVDLTSPSVADDLDALLDDPPAAGWSAYVTRSTMSPTRTGSRGPMCTVASPPSRSAV